MKVILVTGGVQADIGKGCAAAVIGRIVAIAGLSVDYRKLEPCLQGDIAAISNRHFGEIVVGGDGAFDGDVARAAFYIPGFKPGGVADLSLGRAIARVLSITAGRPAPRLVEELGEIYRDALTTEAAVLILEVGGTVGEPEHRLLSDALMRALPRPAVHVHVTTVVRGANGRDTTKPAQLSIDLADPAPDIVLVRDEAGTSDLEALVRFAPPGTTILRVPQDDHWPERAYDEVLRDPGLEGLWRRFGVTPTADPLFARPSEDEIIDVDIVTDEAGAAGYGSLARRLLAWSRGRVRPRFITLDAARPDRPVVRVGEAATPAVATAPGVLRLDIVPVEVGRDARDPSARPDWAGTADRPEGEVALLVQAILEGPTASPAVPVSAYEDPVFARVYTDAGRGGSLRDHAALDSLVRAALPSRRRLKGTRILDLGCGDGRWAAKLLDEGVAEVVGVEPAGPMADFAAARGLARFTVLRSRAEEAEFAGPFDHVLAIMSLDHVEHVDDLLARCGESLRPLGRLILAVEHPMRTAPRAGTRWTSEDDGSRAGRVRDYGEEGWRSFSWFDPPFPVAVYHRPLGVWVDILRRAGLQILAIKEPVLEDPRDAGNPRCVLLIAERPGPRKRLVVIDGPSGAGKSTVGDEVARALGWTHLDTGRIARAFALRERYPDGRRSAIEVRTDGHIARVFLGGKDVTDALAAPELGTAAATLLRDPAIEREYDDLVLREVERLAETGCVLTARGLGRDYPDALARVWLDAARSVREGRTAGALARDAADRARGRLLDADPSAIHVDGADSAGAVAAAVVRLTRMRLCR